MIGKTQVGKYLCFMHICNCLDCFQLHNNLILNQQVNTITQVKMNFLVSDWQRFLPFHM